MKSEKVYVMQSLNKESGQNPCYCVNPLDCFRSNKLITDDGSVALISEGVDMTPIHRFPGAYMDFSTVHIEIKKALSLNEMVNTILNYYSELALHHSENILECNVSYDNICITGDNNNLNNLGDCSNIVIVGRENTILNSGLDNRIVTYGNYNKIRNFGQLSHIINCGDGCDLLIDNFRCSLVNIGNNSKIEFKSNNGKIYHKGDNSNIIVENEQTITTVVGEGNNIIAESKNGIVRATKGNYITLNEYVADKIIHTQKELVDGIKIKENIFYKILDSKFIEAQWNGYVWC